MDFKALVQNHKQPFEDWNQDDIRNYFVNIFTPYQEIIDQIQSAFFLHNIELYCIIFSYIFVSTIFLNFIQQVCGSLSLAFLIYPYLSLCFTLYPNLKARFFKPLPNLSSDAKDRIRTLPEIMEPLSILFVWIWRGLFLIYHTLVYPTLNDTVFFILGVFVIATIGCFINYIIDFGLILLFLMIIVPIAVKTTFLDSLFEFLKIQFVNPPQISQENKK